MDVTFVAEDGSTFCMEVGFFGSFQEIKERLEKITGIAAYRQTLLFNGQVLPNEAIVFNTDISEASRVQFFLDADSGNHVAPPTLSPAPNSNEDDYEITDMHIPGGDELEEMLRWNPDEPPPPPPDKKENLEMPQSIVDIPPPKEELLSSIPVAPQVAPQTPMTVTENALPPKNPEFTLSPPLPLTVAPLKSHRDKE